MASAEKKIERADSLPRKILRGIVRVIVPVLLVSFAAYAVRSCALARSGASVDPSTVSGKTFFQDRGDGYVYLGVDQARVNAKGEDAAGSYTVSEGTVRVVAAKEYTFRLLSSSRILSLDWDITFTEKGAQS